MARTNIATLGVQLTATNRRFVAVMKDSQHKIRGLQTSFARVAGVMGRIGTRVFGAAAVGAAAATAGMVALTKSQISAIDAIAKTSDKLGTSTEGLIALQHAAQLAGIETRTFDMGLQRMTRRVSEAAIGTGEAQGALRELGIDAARLNQLRPDQQFLVIAERMKMVSSQADRVRLAFKLFDSEGVALVNMLKGGASALLAADTAARKFGLSVSRLDAAQVEELNNAWLETKKVFVGIARSIAVFVAPFLTKMNRAFQELATQGSTVAEKVQGFIGAMTDKAESFLNELDKFRPTFDELKAGVAAWVNAWSDLFDLVFPKLEKTEGALNKIKAVIEAIVRTWKTLILEFQKIEQFATGTLADVFDFLAVGDTKAAERGKAVANFFRTWSEQAEDAAKNTKESIRSFQKAAKLANEPEPGSGTGTKLRKKIEDIQQKASDFARDILSTDDIISTPFDSLKDAADDATTGIDGTIESIKQLQDLGKAGQSKRGSMDFNNLGRRIFNSMGGGGQRQGGSTRLTPVGLSPVQFGGVSPLSFPDPVPAAIAGMSGGGAGRSVVSAPTMEQTLMRIEALLAQNAGLA